MNYYGITMKDNYLAHHGVKGQRWGVRHEKKKLLSYKLNKKTRRAQKAMTAMDVGALVTQGTAVLSALSFVAQPFKHVPHKLIAFGASLVAQKLLTIGSKKMYKRYDRLGFETTNAERKEKGMRLLDSSEWDSLMDKRIAKDVEKKDKMYKKKVRR